MATTSFNAGAFTLSGWNSSYTVAGASPGASEQLQTPIVGAAFDFAASTTVPGGSNQIAISDSSGGSDNVQLTMTFTVLNSLADANPGTESGLSVGQGGSSEGTITGAMSADGTLTLGGSSGESASALIHDLRNLTISDTNTNDAFGITFTLTDVTTAHSSTFTEGFSTICYAPGTRIGTPTGEIAVEDLQIGDFVATTSGVAKPVKWLGRRSHSAADVAKYSNLRPVMIRKDALGGGLPHRDLMVSPMHALLIDEVFVPAAALVNGTSIVRSEAAGAVEYIHVELDQHEVIFAEGTPAETFVNDDSRALFDNVSEYYDLYGIAESRDSFSAPRIEEGYQLEAIRRRLAGVAPQSAAPGALAGHVERLEDGVLEGWVMDRANPATPVELEVLVDGEIVATVLANRYRVDLDCAGLAGGRCGFTVAMPASAECLAQVEVRRASDGGQVAAPKRALVTA
jgi:hypothetical protein